jgi:hypothetical protein
MSKGTPRRGVRVEDALWVPALTIAKQRGENLSDIIRAALHDYIEKHQGPATNPRLDQYTQTRGK